MDENKQNRLVRESFIIRILENLYNWLPFKKTTENLDFVVGEENKKVFSISSNGEVRIISDLNTNNLESLQSRLNKIGLTIVNTEQELMDLLTQENCGKFVYLENNGETYFSGLYNIVLNASNHGVIEAKLLGQDIQNELINYYTKDEVNSYLNTYVKQEELNTILNTYVTEENVQDIIIRELNEILVTDEDGNVSINLEGYVTVEEFNSRVSIIEDWMGAGENESGAISIIELEEITNIDLNNDSKIG